MRTIACSGLLAALALSACDGSASGAKLIDPAQRKAAPGFTLKGLDGKEVSLASLRGQPVMLTFWAVG